MDDEENYLNLHQFDMTINEYYNLQNERITGVVESDLNDMFPLNDILALENKEIEDKVNNQHFLAMNQSTLL